MQFFLAYKCIIINKDCTVENNEIIVHCCLEATVNNSFILCTPTPRICLHGVDTENFTFFYLRAQGDERNYLPLRLQCPSSNTTPFDFETAKWDTIV